MEHLGIEELGVRGPGGRAKNFRVSIAPMMDWTDRHYRWMMRLITKETLLYTEMVPVNAIVHGDRAQVLDYSECEHPLALQLGGSDIGALMEAARIAEDWGYDELNLNVGCPSDRVFEGQFGACLMAKPELVADCVDAMRGVVKIPVTVKHRIGIDGLDRFEDLLRFMTLVMRSGCDRYTIHARVAILGGLSPKENRTIPPLRYEDVHRVKELFPAHLIELNGGLRDFSSMHAQLEKVDAVMLGRAAYEDPFMFSKVDEEFFGCAPSGLTRRAVVEGMMPYIEEHARQGGLLVRISRHMLNLWRGQKGARTWRRILSERNNQRCTEPTAILHALEHVSE